WKQVQLCEYHYSCKAVNRSKLIRVQVHMSQEQKNNSWLPTASIGNLQKRAEILAKIRHFFAEREILEIETPLLSHAGTTDPNIASITATAKLSHAKKNLLYLQTSPEFAMKRLLAAGSGA